MEHGLRRYVCSCYVPRIPALRMVSEDIYSGVCFAFGSSFMVVFHPSLGETRLVLSKKTCMFHTRWPVSIETFKNLPLEM